MYAIEFLEVVVRSVEYVVRTSLNGDLFHRLGVVDRCCSDVEEGRYLRLQIIQGVDFNTTLVTSELCPPEHIQS